MPHARRLTIKATLEPLRDLPPFFVYYLARRGGSGNHNTFRRFTVGRITRREIASKVGLSVRSLDRIINQVSWDSVPHGLIVPICDACGITSFSRERHFIKRHIVNGQFRLPHWTGRQARNFDRLNRLWVARRREVNGSVSASP